MNKKRFWIVILSLIGMLIFSIGYYLFFKAFHIGLICPIYETLHYYCPGCGITRMIFSIFELNFYQAFRYNPLLFVYIPFIILILIDLLTAYVHDRKTKVVGKVPMFVWILVFVGTIAFGVIRNIEPFTFLAPTEISEK